MAVSLLLVSSLCAQRWEPAKKPPFARYAVADTFSSQPAPVDLRSDPRAPQFRTRLREGARKGPNFAGHYTITYWNCNHTDCATLAIIDARTGRVYFAPFDIESDIHYQRSSRLLLVDPRTSDATVEELQGPRVQAWYEWNGRRLVLIDSVPMRPVSPR